MTKYILTAAAVLLLSASCGCNNENKGIKEIRTSENTEADLGTIKEIDGPVTAYLNVTNTSADTLLPVVALTRCSCLSASTDKKPVPPGKDLRIEIIYNPAYRQGIFMEEILVRFLDTKKTMSLIIKGDIIPYEHPIEEDYPYDYGKGLHLSHETLHFGKMPGGERGMIYVRYANDSGKDMAVKFVTDSGFRENISMRPEFMIGQGGKDTLHVRFTMPAGVPDGDTLKFSLQPYIDGKPTGKLLEIKAISSENKQ